MVRGRGRKTKKFIQYYVSERCARALMFRWELTEKEKKLRHKVCPKCGSGNLDPAGGWNSANGWIKCYDCGHGPFWWLRVEADI